MDLEFTRRERIVGTFMISVGALLLLTIFVIGKGKGWFEKYIPYYTVFEESYNLQKGASVKLYNTEIGKVKKITLTGDQVRVKLAILEEYTSRLRTDTIATVESPTFIGSEFVSIRTGNRTDAPLILPEGEIPSQEKKSLGDIMAEFKVEETAKMVVVAVQDLAEMARELRDPQGPVFRALENLNRILADLEAGEGTVGSLLKSRELMDRVDTRLDDVGRVLAHVEGAASRTPESVDLINRNLAQFEAVGRDVQVGVQDLNATLAALRAEMDTLSRILKKIEDGSDDVPEITRTTRTGIREIRDGVQEIDRVVKSVQKNPLIRGNLPETPEPEAMDADAR